MYRKRIWHWGCCILIAIVWIRLQKKRLCEALVLSQFNYCAPVYGLGLDQNTSSRIQRVQNSCARFIFGIKKYQHISHKITELKWLNMANRRKLSNLLLYHRILTTTKPEYLFEKLSFDRDVHGRVIRNSNRLRPPVHKTTLFERSFSFDIVRSYNALPDNLKSLKLGAFRTGVHRTLFESQV